MKSEPNYQKQAMYKDTMSKLDKAIKGEFYYEAILIEYALIEDALKRILELLGIINVTKDGIKVTAKARKPLRQLLHLSPSGQFKMCNINTKLSTLNSIAISNIDDTFISGVSDYLCSRINKEELAETIIAIANWKDKRNTVVHDLMNQDCYDTNEKIVQLATDGKTLFRTIDKYAKRLQGNDLRKRFRIQ